MTQIIPADHGWIATSFTYSIDGKRVAEIGSTPGQLIREQPLFLAAWRIDDGYSSSATPLIAREGRLTALPLLPGNKLWAIKHEMSPYTPELILNHIDVKGFTYEMAHFAARWFNKGDSRNVTDFRCSDWEALRAPNWKTLTSNGETK